MVFWGLEGGLAMDGTLMYEIGSGVRCTDCDFGELVEVVVDPVARKLTHLVVDPYKAGQARLVAVGLATPTGAGIKLACTKAEVEGMEVAMRMHFLPDEAAELAAARGGMDSWPLFGMAPGGPRLSLAAPEPIMVPAVEIEEFTPADEVVIRRGDRVHAADGHIGHVRGLVVDPVDDRVTHVLLDEGHLWGHKEVAIPMSTVMVTEDEGLVCSLRKDQIKDLPPVEVDMGTAG